MIILYKSITIYKKNIFFCVHDILILFLIIIFKINYYFKIFFDFHCYVQNLFRIHILFSKFIFNYICLIYLNSNL